MQFFDFLELDRLAARIYKGRNFALLPFTYTLPMGVVTSPTVASAVLRLQTNFDFLLCAISVGENNSAGCPNVLIQVTDAASEEKYWDDFVPVTVTCETVSKSSFADETPHSRPLPYPRRIPGNANVTAQLYIPAAGGVSGNTFEVAFHGVNVRLFD